MPTASAYAAATSYVPPPVQDSADEDTNSGISSSSSAGSAREDAPWADWMRYSPLYRREAVENAFETWLSCRRPWSNNLSDYPFLDSLFDLEVVAFQAMTEWYYARTPSSRRSNSLPQPAYEEESHTDDELRIRLILQRFVDQGIIIRDPQGVAWSGQPSCTVRPTTVGVAGVVQLPVSSRQERHAREEQRDLGARSSHEPPPSIDRLHLGIPREIGWGGGRNPYACNPSI